MIDLVDYNIDYVYFFIIFNSKRNAGKGYLTLIGSTLPENYASIQILSWKTIESTKCNPTSEIICTQWGNINESTKRNIKIRNIGNEPLFIRAYTKSKLWKLCNDTETIINPTYYHKYWDGCSLTIYYDDSIDDLEIYNQQNDIKIKISTAFGSLWNPYFITNSIEICTELMPFEIKIGFCTCERCCDFFDLQPAFTLSRVEDCKSMFSSKCPCYETSKMTFTEAKEFQLHSICTQCKYDSHCKMFNPSAFCIEDPNKQFIIGNPFSTSPTNYGFKNLIRDKGRVTDGKIKGESCNCENSKQIYTDILGYKEQYTTFPINQITSTIQACLDCLAHEFKSEPDCYSVCGNGVKVDALTYTSGESCATCILSGEPFQELSDADKTQILTCFSDAKKSQKVFLQQSLINQKRK